MHNTAGHNGGNRVIGAMSSTPRKKITLWSL